ncbi:MAG: trigger factor [Lachnospiraceae bacterium]|nr:trigger factor [Lachnospiraceae bacterium]
MKSKKIMMALILTVGALALAGCGDSKTEEAKTAADSDGEASADTVGLEIFDYDVTKYVKLGEYKNLSVQYPVPTVSDEDVESYALELVDEYTEYNDVDRAAKNGDCVNIDYVGTLNGEEFDGGSDTDYDVIVGDGEFLEEFENNIIGKKAGESTTFKMTFPEDYDEELGGKEVEFTITVNNVSEVVVPEYTDAFVAEVTEYDTMEAYEDSLREELMTTAQEDSALTAAEDALLLAVENSTVDGYPQDLYDVCYQDNLASYQSYAEMFGMEFEEFMADFMGGESMESLTETWVNEILITHAIAEAEGFMITEDNYQSKAEELAVEYEYETVEDLETDYGKFYIITTLLRDEVLDFIYESADVEEVSEDEYYGEDEDIEMLDTEV